MARGRGPKCPVCVVSPSPLNGPSSTSADFRVIDAGALFKVLVDRFSGVRTAPIRGYYAAQWRRMAEAGREWNALVLTDDAPIPTFPYITERALDAFPLNGAFQHGRGSTGEISFRLVLEDPETRESVAIMRDEFLENGAPSDLSGPGAAALIAASIPVGIPGIPFMGLAAEPEGARTRAFTMDDDEPTGEAYSEEELQADPQSKDPAAQWLAKVQKQQARDAAERESAKFEEERGKKAPRPAEGTAKELEGDQRGVPSVVLLGSRSQPIREYVKTNAPPTAIARWVYTAPMVLRDEGRIFDLAAADEVEGRLTYRLRVAKPGAATSSTTAAVRSVVVRPTKPATTTSTEVIKEFFPAAVNESEALALKKAAQEEAARQQTEALLAFKRGIAPSEMPALFYAENQGTHTIERLYRIPRLETFSPTEKLMKAPVVVSVMPQTLDIDGKRFMRGLLFTAGSDVLVVSYRHDKDIPPFQPHIPTVMERAANAQRLLTLEPTVNRYRVEIRPAALEWRSDIGSTEVVFKGPGLTKVRAIDRDDNVRTPSGLRLFHPTRAEHVAVALTVAGRKHVVNVPIADLRQNQNVLMVDGWRVELDAPEAAALNVWLLKSANAGLGGMDGVRDIPEGKAIDEDEIDYTAVLPDRLQREGYRIIVEDKDMLSEGNNKLDVHVYFGTKPIGRLLGSKRGNAAVAEDVQLDAAHRNKGIGKAMYEALYRDAFDLGATRVRGGTHSTMAHRVHEALAAKHGWDYNANPNSEEYGGDWPQADWEATRNYARDDRWQSYNFALKGS